MSRPADKGHQRPYRRLLIGFNHHMECRSVLDFAAQVSQAAEVEMAGVFVEDQELLDLARLPFSTEFLFSSRQTRNLDFTSVESDLRAIATQMHNALRKLAGQSQRQYSFRTVRGHMWRELIAQAEAGDLILLRTACIPWLGVKPAMNGPVVLLEPPGSGNGNLAALAREIAQSMRQELVIVRTYDGPQSLRNMNAQLIIASASLFNADVDGEGAARFIEAAPCPVLLVPVTG